MKSVLIFGLCLNGWISLSAFGAPKAEWEKGLRDWWTAAADRSKLPGPGYDVELMGKDVAPKEFFEDRQNQTDCRDSLEKARLAYVAANKRAKESDDLFRVSRNRREEYLSWMEKCGDCAVRYKKRTVKTSGKTEYWYDTDGSCYFPVANGDTSKALVKRRWDRLISTGYAAQNGGFHSILHFEQVDRSGKKLAQDNFSNPYLAMMAIRGPVVFGQGVSFLYFFDGIYLEPQAEGGYFLRFQSRDPVPGYRWPRRIYETTPAGTTKSVAKFPPLEMVLGQWWISEDGSYYRYFTAADMKINLNYALDFAKQTLIDTLVEFQEKTGTP